MISADDIVQFWYSEPMNQHWFQSTQEIDLLIKEKYALLWHDAAGDMENEKLEYLKQSAPGCLALIILFDQMPLNMFRGTEKSFATETAAIKLTIYGIEKGYDKQLPTSQLSFFYMPLMHSESLMHQDLAVEKFTEAGLDDNARFAKHHRDIVERFGRFPHRNAILGRESSQAELDYLNSKGAFTG